jgi:glycosyltransferase involved in cell wall biosynthesis
MNNSNIKKILFIIPHLDNNETLGKTVFREIRELSLAKYLIDKGYIVRVYALHCTSNEIININNYITLYPVNNLILKHSFLYYSKTMIQECKIFDPDLIIIKGLGYLINKLVFFNLYSKYFVFIVGGSTKDDLIKYVDGILIEYENQIINLNPKINKNAICHVLPKYISKNDFCSDYEELHKKYDIVCVGDFKKRKNQLALIPLLRKYIVAFVGDGDMFQEIVNIVKDSNLNAIFFGRLNHEDTLKVIRESRIMVHPSKKEGFPRVIVEAFAQGVPVIGLKKVIGNVIINDKLGILVDNEKELEKAVSYLLSNEIVLREMAKNCLEYAKNNFIEEKCYNTFISLINELNNKKIINRNILIKINILLKIIYQILKYITNKIIHKLREIS